MEKTKLIYCLLLIILHASCTQLDILKIPAGEPKLVLNACLTPGQEISAHLTRTTGTGGSLLEAELKATAAIRVYLNDSCQGVMIPSEPEEQEVSAETEPHFRKIVIKGNYLLPGIYPKAGDEVRFEADVEGMEPVTAKVLIPEAPRLLSVDTVRFKVNDRSDDHMRMYVALKEQNDKPNYYRLILSGTITANGGEPVEYFPENYFDYYIYGGYSYYSSYGQSLWNWEIDYEDPVFNADLPANSLGALKKNRQGVFSNDLFRGKDYVLKFSFPHSLESFKNDSVDISARYNVKLLAVSESYYNYYKQTNRLSLTIRDIELALPINFLSTYSNVENGYGLVYSYHETKHVVNMNYVVMPDQ